MNCGFAVYLCEETRNIEAIPPPKRREILPVSCGLV